MAEPNIMRVMDLRGCYKGGGGPDKTVLNSAAQHDSERLYLIVTYIKQPHDHEFQIPEMARKAGVKHLMVVPDRSFIDWKCIRELKRIASEHRLDVVHAHDDKTMLYAWLLRFVVPHIKIMYTCHSHSVYSRDQFSSLKLFLSFKLRQKIQIFLMQRYLKPILTVSDDTKKRLVTNGLADREVEVLHNGIDLKFWQRSLARPVLREELEMAPGCFLVGTVARITYDKDLPTLYRVAQEVIKRNLKVRFVIVGDGYGDELAQAKKEVARLGLEQVVSFTGHRTDLRDLYVSFDLFLMTSLTEGLPNALLEAMAMGVPVVSTSVGGIPEVLEDGNGGFLSHVGDAAGLAGHVLRLFDDPELLRRFGIACRKRIEEKFSFEHRVRKMEEYYGFFSRNHTTSSRDKQPLAHL